jgi:hypothetical protein
MIMLLLTSAKRAPRYDAPKTVTPRPGDFLIGPDGLAVEITRVFAKDGVGWRVLDAKGHVSTAVPRRTRRGLWDSSPEPKPPIEKVCENS